MGSVDERPELREGVLLPVIHRLETEGNVEGRWLPGPQGVRRYYALTARGRRQRRRAHWAWGLSVGALRVHIEQLVPHRVHRIT